MMGVASVDGELTPLGEAKLPVSDPALLLGWSVFETLAAEAGVARGLSAHLARLQASAASARVPWPGEALLVDEVGAVLEALEGPARVRITLTRGGHRVITATPADRTRLHQPVRCARGVHRVEPVLGGRVKHASRAPWAVAVERCGVDDVLMVDEAGRFTEGTTAAVLAVVNGALWTAPDDGRILPSTTVDELVARAERLGVPVVRQGPRAAGGWDGLYIGSSTRDLAPVVELDGVATPGWDEVGRALAALRG